jgi:hypothetical protein
LIDFYHAQFICSTGKGAKKEEKKKEPKKEEKKPQPEKKKEEKKEKKEEAGDDEIPSKFIHSIFPQKNSLLDPFRSE